MRQPHSVHWPDPSLTLRMTGSVDALHCQHQPRSGSATADDVRLQKTNSSRFFEIAGVGGAIGPLTETTVEDWDYTFDVLAKGVFLGIKHGARVLKAQGQGGAIINTASIAGLSGDAGPLVYSAAKAAVISLSKSAAVELAPQRIRVNAICPGFIATPLAAGGDPARIREAFARSQPWPETGSGEHIAGAALFLASDDAAFVTGEALIVDGGLTAAGPELSKKFSRVSARDAAVSGITKGSTGEPPELRRL